MALKCAIAELQPLEARSAKLDAQVLLRHVLGLSNLELYLNRSDAISTENLAAFAGLIKRRIEREPVAYITGSKEFYGLTFKVTPDVLIPRPDTEILVDIVLELSTGKNHNSRSSPRRRGSISRRILIDVCTGSGCIPIAFKHHRPNWKVLASDISQSALDVAKENGAGKSVEFRQGNLLEPFENFNDADVITANPPYIRRQEYKNLDADVLEYEPELALVDEDPNGISYYRRLIPNALPILKSGGILAMEIGYNQRRAIEGLGHEGYHAPEFIKDLAQNHRVVVFKKK